MQLTRHADYAVRVMVDLASQPPGAVIPRAQIGPRQEVPAAYLAKIIQTLARAGLVRTRPGAGGGVSLNVAPDAVTLRRVIETVERPIRLNRCVVTPSACTRSRFCSVHPVWLRVQKLVIRELDAVTIAELARPRSPREREEELAPCC